jgi:hypothetical protein
MCRAITCLSDCIAVTTKLLLFAAEAYPKLEPALRFLDLVSLRFRRGTLKVNDDDVESSISAIMQLPLELWDLVRYELIELEVFCAEQRIARGLLCADCQTTMAPNEKLRWRFPEKEPKCDDCSDLECSFEGILNAQRETVSSARRVAQISADRFLTDDPAEPAPAFRPVLAHQLFYSPDCRSRKTRAGS